jgi:hypothetical protein
MIFRLSSDLEKRLELWGFEPQTSCMPFLAIPSGCVVLRRVLAGQAACSVRLGLAASDAA